jgi:prepilin-type processing-associated H-X9-DG protein
LQYEQDYDEALVPDWQMPVTGASAYTPPGYGPQWMDMIYPYTKSQGVYNCPDDPNLKYGGYIYYAKGPGYNWLISPTTWCQSYYNPGSYAINSSYYDGSDGVTAPGYAAYSGGTVRTEASLEHPDTTVHFTDYQSYGPLSSGYAMPVDISWANENVVESATDTTVGIPSINKYNPPLFWTIPFRHTGGANVEFCDGHVKYTTPGYLLTKTQAAPPNSQNGKPVLKYFICQDLP